MLMRSWRKSRLAFGRDLSYARGMRRYSFVLAAAAALLAWPAWSEELPAAADLARELDMTSFPNSLGPRRGEGKRTLSDFGFVELVDHADRVELYEADRSWMVSIAVLEQQGGRVVICVVDKALDGATYFTVGAIEVERAPDGLFSSTGRTVTHAACAERR